MGTLKEKEKLNFSASRKGIEESVKQGAKIRNEE